MDINKISTGENPPEDINVIIEVPMNANPVKYELDKESGALLVDRFVATPMYYPCNYGFVPGTLSEDGDPIDVLVVSEFQVNCGAVISCKPIGIFLMEDEKGMDEKVLAVPSAKMNSQYSHLENLVDIPEALLNRIKHFFEHYKELEKGKWVKVTGFADAEEAKKLIKEAIKRAKK